MREEKKPRGNARSDFDDMRQFFFHETYGRLVLAQTILGTIAVLSLTVLLYRMM